MKLKILTAVIITVLSTALFNACDDNKEEFLSDYSTILYFLNNGVQDLTLYKTGENTSTTVIINKAGSNLNTQSSAQINVLDESRMNEYNTTNGTSYSILPAACYEISGNTTFEFSGNTDLIKKLDITFYSDIIFDQYNQGNYVLPLELLSADSVNSEKNVVLYAPEVLIPTVSLGQTGYIRNDFVDGGPEEINFTLPLVLPVINKWNFTCTIQEDPTLLDEYNKANDLNYILLPEESYTLAGNGIVTYTEADESKSLDIIVNKRQLTYGNYVLPLRLSDCSKDEFSIDDVNDACLYGISYIPDPAALKTINLTVDMLYSNAVEPSEGSLANLLDGNTDTYFHSAWSVAVSEPHYLQINLDQEYSAFSFAFIGRATGSAGNPASIIMYGSTDGQTFTKIDQITEGLPTTAAGAYESPLFVAPPFKHLRLVVPQNMSGGSYFVFSEFSMKGL